MATRETDRAALERAERDALLGLWCVPGVGPVTLGLVRKLAGGRLSSILDVPAREWLRGVTAIPPAVRGQLDAMGTPSENAQRIRAEARASGMAICFRGDGDYPELLAELDDAPPVLFRMGRVGARRRRVAMVGSRSPDGGFLAYASAVAKEVAAAGVGVISGGAMGIDRACHLGALDVRGETWAFLGSALDQVDPAQMKVSEEILAGNGCLWSELPPGVRADRTTFPRRNRLISGSADAVVVLRAGEGSGTLHTANHALRQGRTLLAMPGDPWLPQAKGANRLLQTGQALLCFGSAEIFAAIGLVAERVGGTLPAGRPLDDLGLSGNARAALEALRPKVPRVLEEVLADCGLPPVTGVTALAELECAGLLVQHPGRLYERV